MKRALASLLIMVATTAGCARTVDGAPRVAGASDPASSELDRMLLSDSQINAIMAATAMVTYRTYTGIPVQPGEVYSDPQCAVALFNTTVPAYRDSGYVTTRGKKISENVNDMTHDVDQAVVEFKNPSDAEKFVASATTAWHSCGGRTVTYTGTDRETYTWTIGIPKAVGQIVAIKNDNTGGWGCAHAMTAKSTIVVDVDACGYSVTDEAIAIVRAITTVSQ